MGVWEVDIGFGSYSHLYRLTPQLQIGAMRFPWRIYISHAAHCTRFGLLCKLILVLILLLMLFVL